MPTSGIRRRLTDVEIPPLPPPFREQLLATDNKAVDTEIADAIRTFCHTAPDIEAAYICAAERTQGGDGATQVLVFAVKLTIPINGPGDSGSRTFELTRRFSHDHPDLMHSLGFRVLADRAVPAFEHYGMRVYERPTG